MSKLSHFDKDGNPRMVDVSAKDASSRKAVAEGSVAMRPETLALIREGDHRKGDVVQIARLAGIMGAKKTPELIPLCHPVGLDHVGIDIELADDGLVIRAECRLEGRTGVEMEALTAVAVAALTVYDMCKAVDREMAIHGIRLVHKSGGKSGTFDANG